MDGERQGVVVPAGVGREMRFGPNLQTVKIGAETGSEHLGIFESVFPIGAGPSAHRHLRYAEAFYVLEGEIEYRLGERRVTATPGTWVFVPAGVIHAFRNVSAGNARHLVVTSPAIALQMVDDLGRVPPEQMGEVLAKYDSELVE